MTLPERLSLRFAREDDIPLVLRFIRELADYDMLDEVVALEELAAGLDVRAAHGRGASCGTGREPVGFALLTTFPPSWGGAESIWRTSARGSGRGVSKALLRAWPRWPWNGLRPPGMVLPLDWNEPGIAFYRTWARKP